MFAIAVHGSESRHRRSANTVSEPRGAVLDAPLQVLWLGVTPCVPREVPDRARVHHDVLILGRQALHRGDRFLLAGHHVERRRAYAALVPWSLWRPTTIVAPAHERVDLALVEEKPRER
jgi:hypothetical protein